MSGGNTPADRAPIVGGNWKLHTTRDAARSLLGALRASLDGLDGVDIVIFPPAPWIGDAVDALAGSGIGVGAQNVYWEDEGAYTGEQSAAILSGSAGYALVGHSERRHVFGERDEEVNRKLHSVIDAGLGAVLAVGETREEREAGWTPAVLRRQIEGAFAGFVSCPASLVLAYEPVWAIGTGLTATPRVAQEACAQARALVAERFDAAAAASLRIQYGGSVNASNCDELMAQPDIDGALVGGASLDAGVFSAICRAAANAAPSRV